MNLEKIKIKNKKQKKEKISDIKPKNVGNMKLVEGLKFLVLVKNMADEYYENDDIKESEFNGWLAYKLSNFPRRKMK